LNASYAYTCATSFYLTSTWGCSGCTANAKACPNGVANACLSGYFLTTSNLCSACGTGATVCTSNTVATTCLS